MKYLGTLTPQQQAKVYVKLAEGVPQREIARLCDVSYKQVRTYAAWLTSTERGLVEEVRASPPKVLTWDLETTNLKSDIGTLRVAGFFDLHTKELQSRTDLELGSEEALLSWTLAQYASADILIGFNSLAFDKNFLNGVAGRYGFNLLPTRVHIDLLMVARYGWKGIPQSYSLANVADIFGVKRPKDKPSKHDWRLANSGDYAAVERLRIRCEEDVLLTAEVWEHLRPYWVEWRGQR